jgi:pantoate--beta-alanine ligase
MKFFTRSKSLSSYIRLLKRKGKRIGFVPTMGYLHEGHLSLIRAARRDTGIVVVSIFVNPAQFGPGEDFDKYPRDIKRDERLARSAGADIIFYPSAAEIYPEGYRTYVEVEGITGRLCGNARPGHFKGVTTIVAKLFNAVRPDIAYFGQKDAQQAIVIKRMAKDLNMDIDIKVMPIVREADGLAMSSRNRYLSARERKDAAVLYESLMLARRLIKKGARDAGSIKREISRKIRSKKSARIEYVSLVDLKELKDVKRMNKGVLIALAVWIGKTRLIDNAIIGGRA